MQFLAGQRYLSNLPIPFAGDVVEDEKQMPSIRHPGRLLQAGCARVDGLFFPGCGIEDDQPAQILTAWLEHCCGNPLAVGRPSGTGISGKRKRREDALTRAVGVGDDDLRTSVRGTLPQEDHLLSVRREADWAVHIGNELVRSTAHYRTLEKQCNT